MIVLMLRVSPAEVSSEELESCLQSRSKKIWWKRSCADTKIS